MNDIETIYKTVAMPTLMEEFGLKNVMSVPSIVKVVVNMGTGEAAKNKEGWARLQNELASMTGQKPKITTARTSIAGFGLRAGQPVGLSVILRKQRMLSFLRKLISIVLPRLRDFRGVKASFDHAGNFTLGMTEHIVFPEIDFSKVDQPRGLEITVVIKNGNPEKSKRLLELLGMPFEKKGDK